MRWLLRYAYHHGVPLDPSLPVEQALKLQFQPTAWRLICRSGQAPFLPILRHPGLGFKDLQTYTAHLIERNWTRAPDARLLALLLDQNYLYFNQSTNVLITEQEYTLLWVCQRAPHVTKADLALVNNWADQQGVAIRRHHSWSQLLQRAKAWQQECRVNARHASARSWHFYCDSIAWRGFEITPLTTPLDLWDEGKAMHSCLYKLRRLCRLDSGSRYFSVQRQGKRVATLELKHEDPQQDFTGMDRVTGRWALLDCRLSYNRLPDEALIRTLQAFAWQYTVWSHRPSRACPTPPVSKLIRQQFQQPRRFA